MENLLTILEKNVNMEQLASDVLQLVVKPALEKAVEKTDTQLDDVLLATLYTQLSELIVQEVKELWEKVDGEE